MDTSGRPRLISTVGENVEALSFCPCLAPLSTGKFPAGVGWLGGLFLCPAAGDGPTSFGLSASCAPHSVRLGISDADFVGQRAPMAQGRQIRD